MIRYLLIAPLVALLVVSHCPADGPKDNIPTAVRQIPPPGIEVPSADRERLQAGLDKLQQLIDRLKQQNSTDVDAYLPDVEIFHRAVDQALRFNEMFAERDVQKAEDLLAEGIKRAGRLAQIDPYWTKQKGLVVRGFRSKLDDTVQPYGLVIPPTYRDDIPYRYRTDVWFHGRGERSVELQFIHTRMHNTGQYQPEDTIVLHPFGRYSNAFKFAGEVDVFEALDHATANYRIDDDRISVRGFSMGGAACWHFAVHYADRWFAANPGAGFSETPLFLQTFQGEVLQPTWWEKTLWQWYDCDKWVTNLSNVPVIAYSGELDRQKQAADVMAEAYEAQFSNNVMGGMWEDLLHVIGPGMGHRIHESSKQDIESRISNLDKSRQPERITDLSHWTVTTRYNSKDWLTINSLRQHWRPSTVSAKWWDSDRTTLDVRVDGVIDFTVSFPPGSWRKGPAPDVQIVDVTRNSKVPFGALFTKNALVDDSQTMNLNSDGSWTSRYFFDEKKRYWIVGTPPWEGELRKRHGLQGPIDDALMDSFLFVTPSGEARHPLVEEWTRAELDHAVTHWRQQMRGDVRVKADAEVTEEDIAQHNLILWGDPASNSVTARIADQLPIQWGPKEVTVGERRFDAAHHAPILIYPNPLNPDKYVVLNSSFTYREYDYLNNARQTPKLPDWAVVDLRVKPDSRWPGKIVDADFFDEKWQIQPPYRERIANK